jgi:hypothetical protein
MPLSMPTCRQGEPGILAPLDAGVIGAAIPGAIVYRLILGGVLLRPPPAVGSRGLVGHGQSLLPAWRGGVEAPEKASDVFFGCRAGWVAVAPKNSPEGPVEAPDRAGPPRTAPIEIKTQGDKEPVIPVRSCLHCAGGDMVRKRTVECNRLIWRRKTNLWPKGTNPRTWAKRPINESAARQPTPGDPRRTTICLASRRMPTTSHVPSGEGSPHHYPSTFAYGEYHEH